MSRRKDPVFRIFSAIYALFISVINSIDSAFTSKQYISSTGKAYNSRNKVKTNEIRGNIAYYGFAECWNSRFTREQQIYMMTILTINTQ